MSKKVYFLWFGQHCLGQVSNALLTGVWIYETTGRASAFNDSFTAVLEP